jgi:hypothetical protein
MVLDLDTYRIKAGKAPAQGMFGYTRDDLARAHCPYAIEPAMFAQFFVETCSCAMHRALRVGQPIAA